MIPEFYPDDGGVDRMHTVNSTRRREHVFGTRKMIIVFWLLVAALLLFVSLLAGKKRFKLIEHNVELIQRRQRLEQEQALNQQVLELVKVGQDVDAIKLYCEKTGVNLKEAKDHVEGLINQQ